MRATHEPLPAETTDHAVDRLQKAAATYVGLALGHEAQAQAYRDRADECTQHAASLRAGAS